MKQTVTEGQILRKLLYEVPSVARFTETESRKVVIRAGGGENEELLCNGSRVSVLQDVKSSVAGWWGRYHNNVNVLYITELNSYS